MRPYFQKMQDWGKPVKVNEKNAEEIKKVEAEIAALVEKNKNAGLAKEVLNKRGEWTVHQRLEYIVDPGTWAPLHILYDPMQEESGTTGVVDGLGRIVEKTVRTKSVLFTFEVPDQLMKYIVEKGSIAVDGISLTVNRCVRNQFHVTMIPHTAQGTTLGLKRVSEPVNIETDIIGKHIERLMMNNRGGSSHVDWNLLAEHGFLR